MVDHDEYDALLEEPFGEGVDWTAIDGMASGNGAGHNTAAAAEPLRTGSTSESDEYFSDNDVFDESFLNEVCRLEGQATANTHVVNAPPHERNAATLPAASSSRPFDPILRNPMHNIARSSSVANTSSDIPPPLARRPMVIAPGPGSPQSTLFTAQVNPSAPSSPPSGRVPANNRAQTNPPPPTSTLAVEPSPITRLCSAAPSKISPQPSPTRKRRRSPASHSAGGTSPGHRAKCRQKASKVLEAIEKVLQCPICFDTIAASHLLTCGHSACGLCLCEWIRRKGDNASCCICRAPHRGALLPNYALDDMAATYFSEKSKTTQEGLGNADGADKKRWEKRKADGKAAVQAAARKHLRKAPPAPVVIPMPSVINYDPAGDEAYLAYLLELDPFGEEASWHI